MGDNIQQQASDSFFKKMEQVVSMIDIDVSSLIAAFNAVEEEEGPITHIYEQFRIFPFVFLSYKDIIILSRLLIKSEEEKDTSATNMICRTLATHFYEFTEDMGEVIGRRMRSQLEGLPQEALLLQKLNEAAKLFQLIKDRYKKELEEVRINVSSHKDFDVRKQITIIENIQVDTYKELFVFTTQFFLAFHDFFVHFRETFRKGSHQ